MTKTIPMLFGAPLVRALLDGRKTQTRRVMKMPACGSGVYIHPTHGLVNSMGGEIPHTPFAPGDLIWVRETWAKTLRIDDDRPWLEDRPHIRLSDNDAVIWRADGEWNWCDDDGFLSERSYWKPSIHMPRWASRLTLRVTDVRAQRLQDISEEDARAEGVMSNTLGRHTLWSGRENERPTLRTARAAFIEHIWDDLYREDEEKSSAANPWVWAISFDVICKNVDEVAA